MTMQALPFWAALLASAERATAPIKDGGGKKGKEKEKSSPPVPLDCVSALLDLAGPSHDS